MFELPNWTQNPRELFNSMWVSNSGKQSYWLPISDIFIGDKISHSVREESISHQLIQTIANWAGGDARIALRILHNSISNAEQRHGTEVRREDPDDSYKTAKNAKRNHLKSKLNPHQKCLPEIVERRDSIKSIDLFIEYCNLFSSPPGERSYRNQMDYLVRLGVVIGVGEGRWREYEYSGIK